MKRNVLFVLLFIGVGSLLAIAASTPESVRTLSQAEKSNIIGGCGHYCRGCGGPGASCTDPSGVCSGPDPGNKDCGVASAPWKDQCVNCSGKNGGCSNAYYDHCFDYRQCTCQPDDEEWDCTTEGQELQQAWLNFYHDPCS